MIAEIVRSSAGTIILWLISAILAVVFGLILTFGSLSTYKKVRILSFVFINVFRGVPTSILVIGFGLGAMNLSNLNLLPIIFPGTPSAFQYIAWGVVFALALGSSGHFAEIFRSAYQTIPQPLLDYVKIVGFNRVSQTLIILREALAIALPSLGARLVHHLHNTAYASLFPIVDLFGYIQGQSNSTFQVLKFAIIGCIFYSAISMTIWFTFHKLEAIFTPQMKTRS